MWWVTKVNLSAKKPLLQQNKLHAMYICTNKLNKTQVPFTKTASFRMLYFTTFSYNFITAYISGIYFTNSSSASVISILNISFISSLLSMTQSVPLSHTHTHCKQGVVKYKIICCWYCQEWAFIKANSPLSPFGVLSIMNTVGFSSTCMHALCPVISAGRKENECDQSRLHTATLCSKETSY